MGSTTLVDMSDLEQIRAAIRPETRLIWAETPTNPYLKIVDIRGVADLIRNHPALLVVDNTFASPYLQNPLALGADLVLHSSTKYLRGTPTWSAVSWSAMTRRSTRRSNSIRTRAARCRARSTAGWCCAVSKTLPVRMERHSRNGFAVAEFLREHPARSSTLAVDHPGHDIAARQMRDFSGMVFTVRAISRPRRRLRGARGSSARVSLGGVESLIEHPGQMTHASVAGTEAEVEDTLLRLSVGIENEVI